MVRENRHVIKKRKMRTMKWGGKTTNNLTNTYHKHSAHTWIGSGTLTQPRTYAHVQTNYAKEDFISGDYVIYAFIHENQDEIVRNFHFAAKMLSFFPGFLWILNPDLGRRKNGKMCVRRSCRIDENRRLTFIIICFLANIHFAFDYRK